MKNLFLILLSFCFALLLNAQVTMTTNVTAGGLSSALTATELSTVTNLTLTGAIDARDFTTMRDNMPLLAEIDLSGVDIVSYSGFEGPLLSAWGYHYYPENSIPEISFDRKISLISIKLPPKVNIIMDAAFQLCTNLNSVELPIDLITIGELSFSQCIKLSNINIPPLVEIIKGYAFQDCRIVSSLSIPSSVNTIYSCAFSRCSGLKSIFANSLNPIDLASTVKVFDFLDKTICVLNVPFGSKAAYQSAIQWQDFTNIVEAPNGFILSTNNANVAAEGSTTTVDITANVDWTASSNQTWLTVSPISGFGNQTLTLNAEANPTISTRTAIVTVSAAGIESQTLTITQDGSNVPLTVTAGGLASAFTPQELVSITKLTLTGTIDARDFKTMRDDMPLLAEVDLSGVTIVAYNGTEGTSQYITDYKSDAVPDNAFYNRNTGGKTGLTSIILPLSINSIGQSAFDGCLGLTGTFNIPSSVKTIGGYSFYGCSSLSIFNIPSSVTSIGSFPFCYCQCSIIVDSNNPNYSSVDGVLYNKDQSTLIYCPGSKSGEFVVPTTVKELAGAAFGSCKYLTSIILPPSLTAIGGWAIESCYALTTLTIPANVKTIGILAFRSNSSLTSIISKIQTPQEVSLLNEIFAGIDKTNCTLYVPYGSKVAYQSANQWQDFTNIVEATNGFILGTNVANIPAAEGSTTTVDITANIDWTASSDQTWLTVTPNSGIGNSTLTFTAEANPSTTSSRMAIVTVSAPNVPSQTVTVTQQLTIDPTKLDAFEPDSILAQASTISSGNFQQHSIYPVGDVDYASFELTNAPAEVTVRFMATTGGRNIQVIAPDGTTVLAHNYEQSNLTLSQNGKYYIRAWNPDNQMVDSYQLSLSIKPIVVDKYEPDNSWEQATTILPFFEQDDHNIKLDGDVDYLKFTISDAPRTVYVDVYDTRSNYCSPFGVWLFDTDGTTQLNYNYTQGQRCGYSQLQQTIANNGAYYIKVAVPQNEGGMRDNYTIKVTTDGTAPVIICNADDRAALVAVYNALNGPNWNRRQGWLTDNVQDWQGVTLNSEGRVTKLNLTQNNLQGTIPTEIGNLTALRYLNLGNQRYVEYGGQYNYLNGSTLPATIGNLVNLEVLSLDVMQFNTELPDVFPGMVNLRELYLDENYFTNIQLPTGILSCSKLERLYFQYNNFSQLPDMSSLTNIQDIQAYMNRFTFEDIEPNVAISNFNYSPQSNIGQPLGLTPEAGTVFTQTIEVGGEHNLYQWYKNDILMQGQTSNTLRIENVSPVDAGIYQLRVTNTLANQLTLYSEPITLYQKELPVYKALEAFYNSTGGANWNNKNNWLSDAPLTSWFGIYQDQNGQYRMEIYGNNLVGQLPASMGDLSLFTAIYIGHNQQLTGSIPESIGNLNQLTNLGLYGNGLTGEIPASIGNLKNLYDLNLENNQLSGSVPATLTDCSNLRYIYLGNNKLENLPNLSAMSNLNDLYIYNNRFEFDDIAPTRTGKPILNFNYNPQQKFGQVEVYTKQPGEALTLTATVGGTGNLYQWFKDGILLEGKTANTLVFDALLITDRGSYVYKVTNPSVTDLTLESEPMSIVDASLLDAFEPDNTILQASTIASGHIQQHSIYPIGDVDYASFELTNAPAEVTARFITTTGGRNIQVIAPDGTTVLAHNYEQSNLTLSQNGKYYIRAWNPDNQLVGSYQLSLNIKPIVLDKYEPDNSREQATTILPFFEQDDHNIKLNGDVDYLKFTISDAPRTVYVDVYDTRSNYCSSFGVWLFDTDGTTQLNYSYTQGQRCGYSKLQQTISTNGTYFVKVAAPQNEGGMRDNYTIKVTTDGTAPVIVCNADDRAALVAIYNALNGPNWNRQQGWLSDNVMDWQGVTLNADGRVTKLNLTQNNLNGTIPTEIGNLTALRYLNLGNQRYIENWSSWNNLYGTTLPTSLANLVNMEVLSLDYLNFNTELPDVFSGMANLRELYLDQNYFTNAQLPAGILNCTKLERLYFQYNNFSQLLNLSSLTNIQDIQAYMNRFTFEDIEPNVALSNFNYSPQSNIGQPLGLTPEAGTVFTQTIEVGGEHNLYQWYKNDILMQGQTSNTLRIENVSPADAGIYQLRITNTLVNQLTLYSEPITLYQKELPVYKALEAFYNSTGGANWNNKTNWLCDAPLTTWYGIYQDQYDGSFSLEMYSNNLIGQLPASMGDLTLFNRIYIRYNPQLTGTIPESIGNLGQIQTLSLYGNALSGEIPSTIGNLKNLSNLELSNNQLSGSVPSTITGCTNLNSFYINNNQIENLPDLSALPQWLNVNVTNNRFQFDDLEPSYSGKPNMNFNYNPQQKFGQALSLNPEPGTLVTQTFEVGGEHNLYQWYKDNQALDGQTSNTLRIENVSATDAGVYELRVTNTVATQLTLYSESITLYQKEMPLFKALEAFYTSTGGPNWNNNSNWLSDEPISSWYGISQNGNGQYRLELSYNNLIGQLPISIGDLTILNSIYIGGNPQLIGAIPESIGNLSQLQSLNLFNNGLSGEIPSSIGNLKNLYELNLENNQLSGSVPATLTDCSNLSYIYLGYNKLENLSNLSAMSNLYDLYIYNNKFEFDDIALTRTGKPNMNFNYNPQQKFGQPETYNKQTGDVMTLTATVGGTGNLYQWFKAGNLIDGKTSNTLVFESLLFTDKGTYTCRVTNPDVPNLTLESMPYNVSVQIKPTFFHPDWTGVGNNAMKINVVTASLDGIDLQFGDEIGLFDGLKCVGAGVVIETIDQNHILQMVGSADDGSGNGFTPGHAISYKVFDSSLNAETTGVTAHYFNQNPLWSIDGKFTALATSYIELEANSTTVQLISLNNGWNIISANLIPANTNLKDLFQPLITAGKLRKVMDEKGLVLEDFGSFGGWKNNIGNLLPTEGYKVNVSQTTTLSIEGALVPLPLEINLTPGWNIISCPSALQQDAMNTFQALIAGGKLKKVTNESGQALEDFGPFGGWKNNMGNLLPGKGYKVNVTTACLVTIQAGGTKSAIILPEILASAHFQKVYTGNGLDHMNINLVNLASSGLKLDDEIGIYDGKNCVGSARIGTDQLMRNQISITASGNDHLGNAVNGFIPGQPITVKLYRDNQEYLLSAETFNNSQGIFAQGESMFAQVSISSTTGLTDLDNFLSVKCYPNPFSELVNMEFYMPVEGKLNVSIYNNLGQLVKTLFDAHLEAGDKNLQWNRSGKDGQSVASGIYTCKITFNQFSTSKKLIIQ